MKKLFCISIVGMFFFLTSAAFALEIKFAHVVNEKDAFHVAAVKFKELVEKGSKGEITVNIFANAKLGDERTFWNA